MELKLSSSGEYWPINSDECYFRIQRPSEKIREQELGHLTLENGEKFTLPASIAIKQVETLEEHQEHIILVHVKGHGGLIDRQKISDSKISFNYGLE